MDWKTFSTLIGCGIGCCMGYGLGLLLGFDVWGSATTMALSGLVLAWAAREAT